MWTIRHDQMTAFADDAFAQVHARVSRHVAATHPEVPIALGDAAYEAWVRELLEAGVALDVTHEENLLRFVEWHATAGVDTALTDAFPWVYDMLGVRGEREDDRVAAVEARMQGLDEDTEG